MKLAFMSLAFLAAGAVVGGVLVRGAGRAAVAGGMVVLIAAGAGFHVARSYWPEMANVREQREVQAQIPAPQKPLQAGVVHGFRVEFLDWVERRLREGERYFFPPDNLDADNSSYQWATYQLMPHLVVPRAEEADVFIFYDQDPQTLDWEREEFDVPVRFDASDPRFAFARRKGGG